VDIRAFIQVIRRHRLAAILGVCFAIALAVFSYVRIDPFGSPMFAYRKSVLWGSKSVLQITQPGFYEGRVTADTNQRDALLELAPLYARLANSDPVRQRMHRTGPIFGGISVTPVIDSSGNGIPLPLVEMVAFTRNATLAQQRVQQQAQAFVGYLRARQIATGIPDKRRVSVSLIKGPSKPFIAVPRKKTLPVIVFLSMLIATCALVLVLDNLASRRVARAAPDELDDITAEPQPTTPILADAQADAQARTLKLEPERRSSRKTALPGPTLALRPTLGSDEQQQQHSKSAEADG
jgi:hypothetical protein